MDDFKQIIIQTIATKCRLFHEDTYTDVVHIQDENTAEDDFYVLCNQLKKYIINITESILYIFIPNTIRVQDQTVQFVDEITSPGWLANVDGYTRDIMLKAYTSLILEQMSKPKLTLIAKYDLDNPDSIQQIIEFLK